MVGSMVEMTSSFRGLHPGGSSAKALCRTEKSLWTRWHALSQCYQPFWHWGIICCFQTTMLHEWTNIILSLWLKGWSAPRMRNYLYATGSKTIATNWEWNSGIANRIGTMWALSASPWLSSIYYKGKMVKQFFKFSEKFHVQSYSMLQNGSW